MTRSGVGTPNEVFGLLNLPFVSCILQVLRLWDIYTQPSLELLCALMSRYLLVCAGRDLLFRDTTSRMNEWQRVGHLGMVGSM